MQVEMVVAGLTMDPASNTPIVLLRERDGERVVPIWIGVIEASAIAFELEKVKLGRPMAHDLMREMVAALGGRVVRVAVVDLRDNTYFAVIEATQGERRLSFDARPSDALALALRCAAPVFCDTAVIERALASRAKTDAGAAEPADEVDRGEGGPTPILDVGERSFTELLDSLAPEAFGKYKM